MLSCRTQHQGAWKRCSSSPHEWSVHTTCLLCPELIFVSVLGCYWFLNVLLQSSTQIPVSTWRSVPHMPQCGFLMSWPYLGPWETPVFENLSIFIIKPSILRSTHHFQTHFTHFLYLGSKPKRIGSDTHSLRVPALSYFPEILFVFSPAQSELGPHWGVCGGVGAPVSVHWYLLPFPFGWTSYPTSGLSAMRQSQFTSPQGWSGVRYIVTLELRQVCYQLTQATRTEYQTPETSLMAQRVRLHRPLQGGRVQSLLGELRSHRPFGQKIKQKTTKTEVIL